MGELVQSLTIWREHEIQQLSQFQLSDTSLVIIMPVRITCVYFVDSKRSLNRAVVYATDRPKAVVSVLFLFFYVALWFILPYYGALHV